MVIFLVKSRWTKQKTAKGFVINPKSWTTGKI